MYTYAALMTITENAGGYSGASAFYEDAMPEIDLDEAAAYLPVACLECQNEFITMTRESNAAMVEAAASTISTGMPYDA